MSDENENKGRREDDAFSKEDVPVVLEEEEEEEHEGVIKEERNENHRPNTQSADENEEIQERKISQVSLPGSDESEERTHGQFHEVQH